MKTCGRSSPRPSPKGRTEAHRWCDCSLFVRRLVAPRNKLPEKGTLRGWSAASTAGQARRTTNPRTSAGSFALQAELPAGVEFSVPASNVKVRKVSCRNAFEMTVARQARQRIPNPLDAGAIPARHARITKGVLAHSAERRACTAEAPGAKPGNSTHLFVVAKSQPVLCARARSFYANVAQPARAPARQAGGRGSKARHLHPVRDRREVENLGRLITCPIVVRLHALLHFPVVLLDR